MGLLEPPAPPAAESPVNLEADLAAQMEAEGERPVGDDESMADLDEIPTDSEDANQMAIDRVNRLLPRLHQLSMESLRNILGDVTADRDVAEVGNVTLPPDLRELVKTSVEAEIARRGDGELLDLWKAHIQPLSVEEMRQAMRDIIGQPQDAQGNMLFQGRPIPRGVFHEMKAVWQRELDKKRSQK